MLKVLFHWHLSQRPEKFLGSWAFVYTVPHVLHVIANRHPYRYNLHLNKVCVQAHQVRARPSIQAFVAFNKAPSNTGSLFLTEQAWRNEWPWKDPIWSLQISDFQLNCTCPAFKIISGNSFVFYFHPFVLSMKPIKIDSVMVLLRVACFVKPAQ